MSQSFSGAGAYQDCCMRQDDVPIPEPCQERWEDLVGGERRRFCERCQHSVYDLSSMTEKRVRRLLVKLPTDLCVSYLVSSDGEIQFQKPAPSKALGLAAGVALSLAACGRRGGAPLPPAPAASASAAPSAAPPAASSAAALEMTRDPPSPSPDADTPHVGTKHPRFMRRGGAPQVILPRSKARLGY